jgi:UDP-N-acetylglucosamine--N-acetylmuramyl-(pentapeptide) pyrophosphoryl-undecaprenol N-acetylglucosamine transferase
VVVAGGGTGGHVYPGVALAHALKKLRPDLDVQWVGAAGRMESRVVPREGLPLTLLPIEHVRGRGFLGGVRALARLVWACGTALALCRRWRPVAVVGLGGFASVPMAAAARLLRVPLFWLEQNAVPGMVTRWMAPGSRCVYVAMEEVAALLPSSTVLPLGNPVREGMTPDPDASPWSGDRPVQLLVVGGSQGARSLNERTHLVARALQEAGVQARWRVVTGQGHLEATRARWASVPGLEVDVKAYEDDMQGALRWCDLALCRSGATTLAELCALGVPAWLIPFPKAADDHQTANARVMVKAGAGWLTADADWGSEASCAAVVDLLRHPGRVQAAARASALLGRPDAARAVATDLLERVGVEGTHAA